MKAQFRSMETIIITIVLVMLFVSGYAIYNKIHLSQFEEKKVELEKARIADINTIIATLPELSCTTLGVEGIACIDEIKAEVFSELSNQEEFRVYEELFGNVLINLTIIDFTTTISPLTSTNIIIYNASLDKFTSSTPIFNPVSVYDPVTKKTKFGMLKTTFYER